MLKLPKKSQKTYLYCANWNREHNHSMESHIQRGEGWHLNIHKCWGDPSSGENGLSCLSLPAFSIWPTLVPAHSWERCCMALPWRPCLHYVSLGMVVEVVQVGEEVRVLTNPDPVNPPATTASVSPSPPAQFPRSKHDKMMKSANQQICSLGPGPKMKTGPTYTLHASKTLRYQNWYL